MFVSPSKLQKNKILRNRTLNFETVSKLRGNMILVPSLSYDSIIKTFNSGLFRPMQLMASFTPRKYRPVGRAPVLVDQKNEYAQLRADTHGRFKKGKVNINAIMDRIFIIIYTMNIPATLKSFQKFVKE